jgi:hypothetical protein
MNLLKLNWYKVSKKFGSSEQETGQFSALSGTECSLGNQLLDHERAETKLVQGGHEFTVIQK